MSESNVPSVIIPMDSVYHSSAGYHFTYFFHKLKEKEIFGTRCPSCKEVFLPPRSFCGSCCVKTQEWIRVGPKGTVRAVSEVFLPILDPSTGMKRKVPHTMVLVQLDGADTLLHHVINDEGKTTQIGSRVEVIFAEKTIGHMKDILGFCLLEETEVSFSKIFLKRESESRESFEINQNVSDFKVLKFSNRVQIPFSYTLGDIGAQFVNYLSKGRLMAFHCQDCNFLNLPPSRFCYSCLSKNQIWKEIQPIGKTIGVARLEKQHRKHLPEDVFGFALVQLKGMTTSFLHHLIDPELKKGDPAQLIFRSQRKGAFLDIQGFRSCSLIR